MTGKINNILDLPFYADDNFSIGKELTQTMKVKRKYIMDKYQSLIEKLHRDTRN
ncbi:MAG: hypothetical protein KAR21_04735 [Spirochaetales bacterium]|nr:hypothetical protein [Spirochaetales bacterium]